MKLIIFINYLLLSTLFSTLFANDEKKLSYIVSDIEIPFWEIMSKGIEKKASKLGYEVEVLSSKNLRKIEIKNFSNALNSTDGVILSPITSTSATFLLKLADKKNIPVVISDIGADKGNFVSFISSNNENGAYKLGKILVKKMQQLNLQDGTVGIIAIPQQRANGKARTKGFLKAINEAGIKSAGIEQQVDFSYLETYNFAKKLIEENPDLKALWLQGSNRYQGAMDAINKSNRDILLICFDSEPEFLQMIPEGKLVGAAMQQPFLMGEKAVLQMHKYLNNKDVKKNIQLEILAISKDNINQEMNTIKRNVLGLEE